MNLGETLNIASHAIEDANTPRLDGVLVGTNWNDETKLGSPANRERIIRSLINHFSGLDLRDANLRDEGGTGNVLGDAYEYLIYQFADDAGKKGGEFYTPAGGSPPHRGAAGTTGRNAHLRPRRRFRRNADLHRSIRAGAGRRRPKPGFARPGA